MTIPNLPTFSVERNQTDRAGFLENDDSATWPPFWRPGGTIRYRCQVSRTPSVISMPLGTIGGLRFHSRGVAASRSTRCPAPSRQGEPFNFSPQVITHTRRSSRFGRPPTASRLRERMRWSIALTNESVDVRIAETIINAQSVRPAESEPQTIRFVENSAHKCSGPQNCVTASRPFRDWTYV